MTNRQLAAGLYVLALVPAVTLAFLQPVWSRVDEAQHADVIAQYTHGVYPVEGQTTVRPEIAAQIASAKTYFWEPSWPVTSVSLTPVAVPPGIGPEARAVWMERHIWQYSYEAMQPPLFYALATPVWVLGHQVGGLQGAVHSVRLLNALLLALLAPIVLLIGLRLWPVNRPVGIVAGVLTAVIPGLVLNGSQVTNDTLAAVLSALALLMLTNVVTTDWTHRRSVLIGAAIGLGLLAKPTAAALVAAFAVALLLHRSGLLKKFTLALSAAIPATSCVAVWIVPNLFLYHALTPAAAVARLTVIPPLGTDRLTQLLYGVITSFMTFWVGEPLSVVGGTLPLAVTAAIGTPFALAGIARALRQDAGPSRQVLMVLLAALAVEIGLAVGVPAGVAAGGFVGGRYLYPVLTCVLLILAAGLFIEFPRPRVRAAIAALLVGTSVIGLGGLTLDALSPGADNRGPGAASAILPASGAASFSDLTIRVDKVAQDPGAGLVWLHICGTSTGGAVEWLPVPKLRISANEFANPVPSPAPIAGVLEPGATSSGWIGFRHASGKLPPSSSVRFYNVATDQYRTLGGVVFSLDVGRSGQSCG